MASPLDILIGAGHRVWLQSYSALDRYFRLTAPGPRYVRTDSSLVDLARLFEDLRYPGGPYEDACVEEGGVSYLFSCDDGAGPLEPRVFSVQELLYDPTRDSFLDPHGVYPDLRREELVVQNGSPLLLRLAEAARLVSRYHYEIAADEVSPEGRFPRPEAALQREILLGILAGEHPEKGLHLLSAAGFIAAFWPEIDAMASIPHVKDYHPEGDVWAHTLETFQYRKDLDPVLSLGLLLHDVGKPAATATAEKPFDRHAELGAEIAARFLGRLGFSPETVRQVTFLVRYHMMPAALPQLPLYRSERVMGSPLFPALLELYRADLSASYWGPDGYYEACRVYRTFLRNRANPYRRTDGKKQKRKGR